MTYKKKAKTFGELKRRVDRYFESRLAPVTDKNGVPMTDENGDLIKKVALPYTLTGLALAVGCDSRDELYSFEDENMNKFMKMSAMRVEEFAEEKLFTKEAFSGVKLFLAVNFDRWRENDGEAEDDSYELPNEVKGWTV